MPSELTPKERIAKLETWREEHTRQDDIEIHNKRGALNRKFIIIAALIGLVAVLAASVLSTWLVSRFFDT